MIKALNKEQKEIIRKKVEVIRKEYPFFSNQHGIEFSMLQCLDIINDYWALREVRKAVLYIVDYIQNITGKDIEYWKVWISDEYESKIFWRKIED